MRISRNPRMAPSAVEGFLLALPVADVLRGIRVQKIGRRRVEYVLIVKIDKCVTPFAKPQGVPHRNPKLTHHPATGRFEVRCDKVL